MKHNKTIIRYVEQDNESNIILELENVGVANPPIPTSGKLHVEGHESSYRIVKTTVTHEVKIKTGSGGPTAPKVYHIITTYRVIKNP